MNTHSHTASKLQKQWKHLLLPLLLWGRRKWQRSKLKLVARIGKMKFLLMQSQKLKLVPCPVGRQQKVLLCPAAIWRQQKLIWRFEGSGCRSYWYYFAQCHSFSSSCRSYYFAWWRQKATTLLGGDWRRWNLLSRSYCYYVAWWCCYYLKAVEAIITTLLMKTRKLLLLLCYSATKNAGSESYYYYCAQW